MGGDPGALREQRRGLAGDDLEIVVGGDGGVAAEPPLHHLALGEADACVGRPAYDRLLEPPAQLERLAEQEITGHERVGEAVAAERGGAAATRLAAVDDVVVQEGRRMNELERDRDVQHVGDVVASAGLEDEERDRRADAFAAAAIR